MVVFSVVCAKAEKESVRYTRKEDNVKLWLKGANVIRCEKRNKQANPCVFVRVHV